MPEILYYTAANGASPFREWLSGLDGDARRRVAAVLLRMQSGNLGDFKSVGGGVLERRMNFGPGYRAYFGRDGDESIVLLAGGTKRRQSSDIRAARRLWSEYLERRERQQTEAGGDSDRDANGEPAGDDPPD